jgi:hypothetical protein
VNAVTVSESGGRSARGRRRQRWVALLIFIALGVLAAVALLNRSAIHERYLAWRLGDASVDEGWEFAARLDAMRSVRAVPWYIAQLESEYVDWRGRALRRLTAIGTRAALREVLLHEPLPSIDAPPSSTEIIASASIRDILPAAATVTEIEDLFGLLARRYESRGRKLEWIGGANANSSRICFGARHADTELMSRISDALMSAIDALREGGESARERVRAITEDASESDEVRQAARVALRAIERPRERTMNRL